MILLFLYGVSAIGVSFLCSLLEACLLSLPRSYVEALVEGGSRAGERLRRMKTNIDRPLAAILTMNTIAHTVGAAGVGAQAAVVFGSAAVGIASALMTLLILVVSEIIPKTLGAVHARSLAAPAALIIQGMIVVCYPLIVPLEWVNRALGYQRGEQRFSRAELVSMIRLGQVTGAMEQREYRIATNLIALSEVRLTDVMTPRTVVFSLPASMSVGRAVQQHHPFRFDRIPIYQREPEQVTGYVARFDIETAHVAGETGQPLQALAKPIPAFPDLVSVGHVLEQFIRRHDHLALVIDEYGGLAGLVTLEDLLETLLGAEIVDETDTVEDLRELARRRNRGKGLQG